MIRLLFLLAFVGVVIAVIFLIRSLSQSSGFIRCSRCEGKGFWLGARGREKCDWCNGSGRLPRNV